MLKTLLKGELQRLVRYKILQTGLIVSLIWVVIVALMNKADAENLTALLIFTDTGIMSVLLIGAMMYFEKQEGTLRTTFITPVKIWQILFAKISASVIVGLVSSLLVSLTALIIHGIDINIPLILVNMAIVVTASCSLGFIFIFNSRDFNALLINYMMYLLVLLVPFILFMLGVLPQSLEDLQLVSPLYVSMTLMESALTKVRAYALIISYLYNTALSFFILKYYAGRKLKAFSTGG
jgi:fluoroquinolone transport system permease protein